MYTCKDPIGNWEIYQDPDQNWRWRIRTNDDKIIGSSSRGFESRGYCTQNARLNGMICNPSNGEK